MLDGLVGQLWYYSLSINLLSLAISGGMIYWAYRRNNVIAVLYWAAFIFLVVGQALHVSICIEYSMLSNYLGNNITVQGHGVASLLLLCIVLLIAYFECARSLATPRHVWTPAREPRDFHSEAPSLVYYGLNIGGLLAVSVLLIFAVGGPREWIRQGRPSGSGATAFIMSLGFFTVPLLSKYAFNLRPALIDYLLFAGAVMMKLSVSRLLAMYDIVLFFLIYVYSRSLIGETRVLQRYKFGLVLFFVSVSVIYFGFGSYRHIVPMIQSNNPVRVFYYMVENPSSSLFSLDLNYRVGIEGYSGFAAIISDYLERGELRADFGLSNLNVFFQLAPAQIRQIFGDLPEDLYSYYWWQGSNVGGALEGFLVHFSFTGVLLYPLAFYVLAYGLNQKLLFNSGSRISRGLQIMFFSIIAAYGLNAVRGSTRMLLVYWVAELIVCGAALALFFTFYRVPWTAIRRVPASSANAARISEHYA